MKCYNAVLPSLLVGGLMLPILVSAADADYYSIVKLKRYEQTSAAAPTLLTSNAYSFVAFVVASSDNAVTNATVKTSTSTPQQTLNLVPADPSLLGFTNFFSSQSALDALYPTTTGFFPTRYTNTMFTVHDSVQRGVLSFYLLVLPLSYPPVPQITSFTNAQPLNPAADFLLQWSLSGGNVLHLVQITVADAAGEVHFNSPPPFQPGALNGTSNSIVIPAHTLPVGRQLEAHITVALPGNPNTNDYVGAMGVPAMATDVAFPIITQSYGIPTLSEWGLIALAALLLLAGVLIIQRKRLGAAPQA